MSRLCQPSPGAALELQPLPESSVPEQTTKPGAETVVLEVLACAPSPWDLVPPRSWPRVPGGVVVGRTDSGEILACGGFIPCGSCPPCQVGGHLACLAPLRPGWNMEGGSAARATLPSSFLAPGLSPGQDLAAVAAITAGGGLVYQAAATIGMSPGDAVVVRGAAGPGALPLRVLAAAGLRPFWITSTPATLLPENVEAVSRCPPVSELPTGRIHLVDLKPSTDSIESWLPLARHALSCTLIGPDQLPSLDLGRLLGGQLVLRWIRDLHPHLVLDLASLVLAGRVQAGNWVRTFGLETFGEALDELVHGTAKHWPVLTPCG